MRRPQPAGVPHYTRIAAGAGPWLVMVHGASQDSRLFAAQQRWFGDRYRLLLIDLPGHGGSSKMPGPYGLVEYARSVRAALDDAGIDAAHYWGTHTGAGVGLLLAAQGEPRLRSLVLESPVLPGFAMPYIVSAIAKAGATMRASGIDAARREWFAEAEWFDVIRRNPSECRSEPQWAMIAAFEGGPWLAASSPEPVEPLGPRLPAIEAPVLVINGEHDVVDFVRVADELESALPNVERAVVSRAGGFPLWEFPDRVNARVEEFLNRQKP